MLIFFRIAAEEKTAFEKSRLDEEATEAQHLRDETKKVKLEKESEVARLANEKLEKEQEIKQAEQLKAIAEAEKAMLDEAIATDKACIENNAAVLKDLEQEKELTEQNVDELTKATEKLNEQKEDLSTTVNELADSVQKLQEEKELLEVSKHISQTETVENKEEQVESVLSLSNENAEDAPENKQTEPITEEQVENIPEMEAEANEPVMVIPKVPGGEVKSAGPGKVVVPNIEPKSALSQIFWDNVYVECRWVGIIL